MARGHRGEQALTLRAFPESPIRILASFLTAMLLAIGLGVAGYSAVVAVARSTSGAAPPLPRHAPLPVLPPLSRLGPVAETKHFGAPATGRKHGVAPFSITVVVRGVPAALRTTTGGVWLARADGQGNRTWLPWHDPSATPATADQDIVWTATLDHVGDHVVAAATAHEFGQHGYLARRTATCTGPATIDLDASTSEVVFRLPPLARQVGPLRVARVDDPQWLPAAALPTGLSLAPGSPVRCRLGHGAYELHDPLRPEVRQAFVVPAADDVVISANLAAPRADRP